MNAIWIQHKILMSFLHPIQEDQSNNEALLAAMRVFRYSLNVIY